MEEHTALFRAMDKANEKAQKEFVRRLIKYKVDPNLCRLTMTGYYKKVLKIEMDGSLGYGVI